MTPYYGTGRRTDWLAGWLGYTHWTAVIIDLPPSLPFPLLVLTPLYSLSPSFLPSPSSSSLFFPCISCHSTTTRTRNVQIHTQKYTRGNTLAYTHTSKRTRTNNRDAHKHTQTHTRSRTHGREENMEEVDPRKARRRPKIDLNPAALLFISRWGFLEAILTLHHGGFILAGPSGSMGAKRSSPPRHVLLLLLLGLAPSTIHSFGVLAGTKKRLAVPPRPSTSLGALPQAHSPHRAAAKPTETLAWPRAEAESSRTRPVAPDLHQARVALRGDPRALPRAMGGPPPPRRRTVFQKGFPHKRTHWRLLRSAASSPPLAKGKRKALLARPKLTALLA